MILFNKKLTALQQALISKGHPPKVADIKKPTITNSAETGRFTNAAEIINEGEKILALMRANKANAQPAVNRAATATASSKTPSLDSLAARIKSLTASAKALTAGRTPKAAADKLAHYGSLQGQEKRDYLAKHGVEIQALAKARAKQAR